MEYYIVTKAEPKGGEISHTPIGYTTNKDDADFIESQYCMPFCTWVKENMEALESKAMMPSVYFESGTVCYEVGWVTDSIEGLNLPLIEDVQNIE